MKQGNLANWSNVESCYNLLFFSELVNELLFDYSIPSNRVATLNTHYLCLDAISAIEGIENHGVPEGTLKPIVAELYLAIAKDPAFADTGISPLRYFIKYEKDKPRISQNVSELNYQELKKAVLSIHSRFFTKNDYYNILKEKTCDIVQRNNQSEQIQLFRLTKSLLTELIDFGYSQRYIFDVMNTLYWNPQNEVNSPSQINDFFKAFDFTRRSYTVVFVVSRSGMKKFVGYIDGLSLSEEFKQRTARRNESKFLNKGKKQAFLVIEQNGLDPYEAANSAKQLISFRSAFYRLCDHEYKYDINRAKCGVYYENQFYQIPEDISAVKHIKMPSDRQISESMNASNSALSSLSHQISERDDFYTLINASLFHAQSLDTTSQQNQLLDLWAIFESVLDISNAHTSERITQICMYLVPILKRKYVFLLFEQLASDIKRYSENEFYSIAGTCKHDSEIVQKICEFVLLDDMKEQRTAFLDKCQDFPLLRERITYYNEKLRKPIDAFRFVEKHADYVRWQIMRIYRNRNLIIHNGDSMPYLHLLIENLHSYVDEFFSYTIHCLSNGHNVESMCQELFAKECDWIADFSNNKAKMSPEMISKMLSI